MAKNRNPQNELVPGSFYTYIPLLERRNFKQSFGGSVNARGTLDQK